MPNHLNSRVAPSKRACHRRSCSHYIHTYNIVSWSVGAALIASSEFACISVPCGALACMLLLEPPPPPQPKLSVGLYPPLSSVVSSGRAELSCACVVNHIAFCKKDPENRVRFNAFANEATYLLLLMKSSDTTTQKWALKTRWEDCNTKGCSKYVLGSTDNCRASFYLSFKQQPKQMQDCGIFLV